MRKSSSVVAGRVMKGVAIAGAAGAGWVALQWLRYGHPVEGADGDRDALLDRFMPTPDVVERHRIVVGAPAEITLDAAARMELGRLPVVRAVFAAREWLLGSRAGAQDVPPGLLEQTRALGWGTLAERPGREIVRGAVTRPWEPNPTFRAVPPETFAAFDEPAYVKIAWTLRADPLGEGSSIFRTETRAVATDAYARTRFRIYWALLSPGIWLIRRASLCPIRQAAERRATPLAQAAGLPGHW